MQWTAIRSMHPKHMVNLEIQRQMLMHTSEIYSVPYSVITVSSTIPNLDLYQQASFDRDRKTTRRTWQFSYTHGRYHCHPSKSQLLHSDTPVLHRIKTQSCPYEPPNCLRPITKLPFVAIFIKVTFLEDEAWLLSRVCPDLCTSLQSWSRLDVVLQWSQNQNIWPQTGPLWGPIAFEQLVQFITLSG